MPSANNIRIAKNTLMLYFRMLLIMGVSLFTVRIVLNTLGVVDYGIYNVVGGVVTMFSFLNTSMSIASQRYFAFELGKKNYAQLKKTFSMTMIIYVMIALVILILAETVGLWLLNNKLTIPAERMGAANWVYQFAILSFMMTMFTVPYNAAIIAHENMKVYAWVSIIEVILKLLVVYMLLFFSKDKLKLYALLTFGVTTLVTFLYRTYCMRKYEECRLSYHWDSKLFREMIGYSGWNLFGTLANVFNNQGVNILLNMFFGPVVNAARAIAFQVNGAINQFVQNFMTAARPQITKYYASGEQQKMEKLVFQSSKFSFLLLFILSMPVLLETDYILKLWLKNTPDYVVLFTRLAIVAALIDTLSNSLMTVAQATGKLRKYMIIVGGIMLINLPISYFFLKLGYSAHIVYVIAVLNSIVCLNARLILLAEMAQFPVCAYFQKVIFPLIITTTVAYVIPFIMLNKLNAGGERMVIIGISGLITSFVSAYFLVLTKNEKIYMFNIMINKILTKKNKTYEKR